MMIRTAIAAILLITSSAFPSEMDLAADVCMANSVVVGQKASVPNLGAMPPDLRKDIAKTFADSEKELAQKMARYQQETKKKFDLKRCTTEAQMANQKAYMNNGSSPKDDASVMKGFTDVSSEPEVLRMYCMQQQMMQVGANLSTTGMPAKMQKDMTDAQVRQKQMQANLRVSYEKRFKKPLDEKRCNEIH